MTPFEEVKDDEMEYCMDEEWEVFKSEHPDVGDSHETVFRYAYAQGWDDRGLKDSAQKKKRKEWNGY